jgi:hypothetical protein
MSHITSLKTFQPWKIYCVESSLDYIRRRNPRQVALTISLSYATIKEWYYQGWKKYFIFWDRNEKWENLLQVVDTNLV